MQQDIEIYNTTGAIGAARACSLIKNDYSTFSSFLRNDHIMTYEPLEDTSAYTKAYNNWKKELELIVKN